MKLSNGLIINWGTVSPTQGGTIQNFAIPFTQMGYSIGATNDSRKDNQIRAMCATSKETTSFRAWGQYSQSNSGMTTGDVAFTWIAIGY